MHPLCLNQISLVEPRLNVIQPGILDASQQSRREVCNYLLVNQAQMLQSETIGPINSVRMPSYCKTMDFDYLKICFDATEAFPPYE